MLTIFFVCCIQLFFLVLHAFSYDYKRSSSWPNLHLNQEFQGPYMSLQVGSRQHYVGSTYHQSIRGGNNDEENEVDLEFRLGQDL